jgi:hypothetical protein
METTKEQKEKINDLYTRLFEKFGNEVINYHRCGVNMKKLQFPIDKKLRINKTLFRIAEFAILAKNDCANKILNLEFTVTEIKKLRKKADNYFSKLKKRDLLSRKEKERIFMTFYDPNIPLEENLKIFEEHGLKMSLETARVYMSRKGIKRRNNNYTKFKSLYNPNLSLRENLKIFKEHGLKASIASLAIWKNKLSKEIDSENKKEANITKENELSFPDQITEALKDLISKSRKKVGLGGTIEIFKPIYDELISENDKINNLMRESTRQIQEHQKKLKEFETQLYGELFKNEEVD